MTDAALAEVDAIRTRVLDALEYEDRRPLRPRRTLTRLLAMPDDVKRDPAHMEACVLICAAGRLRPYMARCLLGRMSRAAQTGRMSETRLDALRSVLLAEIGSPTIPFHGYGSKPFGTLGPNETQAAFEAIHAALAPVRALAPAALFANSGTLLGIVREGRLLPHDDDFDFGVLMRASTMLEAAQEWALYQSLLCEDAGFERVGGPRLTIQGRASDGRSVDLFPAWIENGSLSVYPYAHGSLDAAAILPTRRCDVSGFDLPAEAERVLAANFGANWMKPEVDFIFPWKQANRLFAPFAEEVARHAA